jgi:DNA-binding NarL/FixJ family response regulator
MYVRQEESGVAKPPFVQEGRRRPLTDRQLEVLRLIAQGLATDEIGLRLKVSKNTVRGYVRVILLKLGAKDRAHAVAIAMREGLLT